jgi:hypothetical protein
MSSCTFQPTDVRIARIRIASIPIAAIRIVSAHATCRT